MSLAQSVVLTLRSWLLALHSLGSIVAYEVARTLARRGLPTPILLVASAHNAPQNSASSPFSWLHPLGHDEFVAAAAQHGALPRTPIWGFEIPISFSFNSSGAPVLEFDRGVVPICNSGTPHSPMISNTSGVPCFEFGIPT
eukprot:SAG31_NODE_8995_length_1350_cov_2.358913_1_plen_140_part_10